MQFEIQSRRTVAKLRSAQSKQNVPELHLRTSFCLRARAVFQTWPASNRVTDLGHLCWVTSARFQIPFDFSSVICYVIRKVITDDDSVHSYSSLIAAQEIPKFWLIWYQHTFWIQLYIWSQRTLTVQVVLRQNTNKLSINFSRRKHRSDYRLSNQRGELYSNILNCARLQLRYFDTACAHVNTNFANIHKNAKKMQ